MTRPGDQLAEIMQAKPPRIIPTRFPRIDKVTAGGFRSGDISVVGAFEGMGKSALAEMLALGIGREPEAGQDPASGLEVGLFSLEMGKAKTLTRLGAKLARCSEADFQKSGMDLVTQDALNRRRIHVYESKDFKALTIGQIEAGIRRYRHPYWIIDHTREIDGWIASGPGAHANATLIVQRLKRLVRELGIHITLCAQLSPDGIGKPVHFWKTMDTIQLMHSSSLTLWLYRPFYLQGGRDEIAHVIVRKNRFGPMCTLHYRWVGATMSFWEMTDEEIERAECCQRKAKPAHA